MARENFERSYARVRVYEGGNVDDPRDPGGRTSRGVIQRTYNAYRARKKLPVQDVFKASEAEVSEIYRLNYWERAGCDHYPTGVDFVVFDGAINSGVGQSVKWAQRALAGTGDADGVPGSLLYAAMDNDEDNDRLIARILANRLGMLHGLKVWKIYGKGWSARLSNLQKIAQAWASGTVGPPPVKVAALGGNAKATITPEAVSKPIVSTATAGLVSAASSAGSIAADLGTQFEVFRDLFAWAPYALGGLAVTAALSAIIVKYGHSVAKRLEAGDAFRDIDPDADAELEAVDLAETVASANGAPRWVPASSPIVLT